MLKNYLKIALRNLRKNRGASVVNIVGLAIGLACCTLILLFIQDELSYDRYHSRADQIVRVVKDFVNEDGSRLPDATTPPALAPAMVEELPEVEKAVRLFTSWGGRMVIEKGEEQFYETEFVLADSTFFEIFDLAVLAGSTSNALQEANQVVLTESTAHRYFGEKTAIGRLLTIDGRPYIVQAVVKDIPSNSHFHFDLFLPIHSLDDIDSNWGWYNFYTYALLKPNARTGVLDEKIQAIYERSVSDAGNIFYTQRLTDIHLKSDLKWELATANGDIRYVYIFGAVALLILLIAAANYINLATARSASRAKEVGIRKTSGARRGALIFQFLTESVLVALCAGALAAVLVEVALPLFNQMVDKQIAFLQPANGELILLLLGAAVIVGLVAGIYPALYLSGFQPVVVLKSFSFNSRSYAWLRRALVIGQFAIASALIACVLLVFRQMQFIQQKDLGFEEEQLIVLTSMGEQERWTVLKSALEGVGEVVEAGASSAMLGGLNWTMPMVSKGMPLNEGILVNYALTDFDFFSTVGFELLAGRTFSRDFPGDSTSAVILNETAAKTLGLRQPFTSREVCWEGGDETVECRRVVGVVADFHFSSMRDAIKPYAFILEPQYANNLYIRLASEDYTTSFAAIRKAWERSVTDYPFHYELVDDKYQALHRRDDQFQSVLFAFSLLAIFVACLGLLALVAYTTEQRIKEIGIRKVLGASVRSIVLLLSREFLWLVAMGLLVAIPVAWYGMNQWLDNFAFRIDIDWWVFGLTAIIAIVIAFATMSIHAFRAASKNPVEALRYE